MEDATARIAELLHEAAATHHVVFRITDGVDEDWATWYANWLVTLSELPTLVSRAPVRSELTDFLVRLDRDYTAAAPDERWEDFYARELLAHFSA
jgi:hypothetical protein